MNAAAQRVEGNAKVPVLYTALELSDKTWKVVFGDGVRHRQVDVPAGELVKFQEAVAEAKERLGLASSALVLSCYEAGRDGFWLHRHLRSVGVENEGVDSSSIVVSRGLRRAKTDRLAHRCPIRSLLVIHGVQHVYHAPVWLARWPSDDRRTRMVFIGRNIRESWVRSLLDLLDAEVEDETARRAGASAAS